MKWIEFVKDYAKKNNIKYGEALKKAKDAWKKHKAESPEHKSKPKKKGKSKGKKDNIQMKITAQKSKNVSFALEKDAKVQESLKKRKAKEELADALSKEKGQTELILEARAKGFSASEAPQEAKKQQAKQKIKIAELKSDAGVPIGGAFDPNVMKGVRKTKLTRYKKLKAKVMKDIKDGKVNNREFNGLINLAKHLAGNSKTNQYAKLVKKLEKDIKSKAYGKASRIQMRQAQKDSVLTSKLERATLQEKGRVQRQAISKVYKNRVAQLKRLGATEEEAEKIAKEETRTIKEQQDLQRELQIAKFRKGGVGRAVGGLTYQQFVDKTAKEKGISYNQAQTAVKNNNAFQKYQLQAVKNTTGILPPASTIVPTIAPTTPAILVERGKYITKGGKVKASTQKVIDRLIAGYKGQTTPQQLYQKGITTQKKLDFDLNLINEYKMIGILSLADRNALEVMSNNLTDYSNQGIGIGKPVRGRAPAPKPVVPPKPVRARSLPKAPSASPPPSPTGLSALATASASLPPVPTGKTGYSLKTAQYIGKLSGTTQEKYDKLSAYLDDLSTEHLTRHTKDESIIKNKLRDLDQDIQTGGSGAGLFGGSFAVMRPKDLEHDGDEELGGAINVRELGKKFTSSLTRKLNQVKEPINLLVSGVGAITGRKVKTQNAIDKEDKHLLEMTIDSYSKPIDRRKDLNGFQYNSAVSNEEHAVYVNEAIKKVVVAYRGSRTQEDWLVSDKHIAKGTLEQSDRYKRELKFTNDLVAKIPKDYEIEFTGSSLGGTLAYSLGHATKQRAVVFNPGVGIDKSKETRRR